MKNQVDEFIRLAQDVKKDLDNLKTQYRASQEARWQRYAGPFLSNMLKSLENTETFLQHADPKVRFVALDLTLDHWGVTEAFARRCEDIGQNDPAEEVREIALLCLGRYHKGDPGSPIAGMLANIVRNDQERANIRMAAYHALCNVGNMPLFRRPPPAQIYSLDFIDWHFVDRFLT